jgi:hypothetical protein
VKRHHQKQDSQAESFDRMAKSAEAKMKVKGGLPCLPDSDKPKGNYACRRYLSGLSGRGFESRQLHIKYYLLQNGRYGELIRVLYDFFLISISVFVGKFYLFFKKTVCFLYFLAKFLVSQTVLYRKVYFLNRTLAKKLCRDAIY